MYETPDPWDVADATGAPSEDEVKREMWEDSEPEPIEGDLCLVCGEETLHPIYEVTNLTQGGEPVGVLCSNCTKVVEDKPYTEGLTEETPIEVKESLLGVGLRILKTYPGSYGQNVRHWTYTEDKVQIVLISNIPIKNIKIEKGIPDYLTVENKEEQTDFTCEKCGAKWNLVSHPDRENDRCPECGKKTSRNNQEVGSK